MAEIFHHGGRTHRNERIVIHDKIFECAAGTATSIVLTGRTTFSSSSSEVDGKMIRTFVPLSGALVNCKAPPSCSTRPWLIDRPNPVPLPVPLVEKNGSTARRNVSASMPVPVSVTATST